jgi:toxin ParE1/3/4
VARPSRLIWAPAASNGLDEIVAWIAVRDPAAASRLVDRIFATVERLLDFPDTGRRVPELRDAVHRELIVAPCRIIYRRDAATVRIVLVTRGERKVRRSRLR